MPSPKSSPWYSTSQSDRKKKKVQITLSEEARAKLERLVKAKGGPGMRSKVVEDLIMEKKE